MDNGDYNDTSYIHFYRFGLCVIISLFTVYEGQNKDFFFIQNPELAIEFIKNLTNPVIIKIR